MISSVSGNGFVKIEVKKEEMLPGYIQTIDRLSQVKESMKVVGALSFGLTLGSIFLTLFAIKVCRSFFYGRGFGLC